MSEAAFVEERGVGVYGHEREVNENGGRFPTRQVYFQDSKKVKNVYATPAGVTSKTVAASRTGQDEGCQARPVKLI